MYGTQQVSEVQDRISALVKNELPKVLEKLFSDKVPPDVLLTIDRLELDVGPMHWDQLETNFSQHVRILLEEQLTQTVYRARNRIAGAQAEWKPLEKATPKMLPEDRSELMAIRYYLHLGLLPWWLSVPQTPTRLIQLVARQAPIGLQKVLLELSILRLPASGC